MMAKLKERYQQARQEDDRKNIVHKVMQKSTGFHKANHRASSGAGRRHVVLRVPRFPLEDYIWWVSPEHGDSAKSSKEQCDWWCAAGGQ